MLVMSNALNTSLQPGDEGLELAQALQAGTLSTGTMLNTFCSNIYAWI